MPTRDETMAALDQAISAAPPPPADVGELAPDVTGATVDCQVCGTTIDTVTGAPAEGAAALSPLDAGGPPAMSGGAPLPF